VGKFADLERDVFSVFSHANWKLEKIPTHPSNFQAQDPEYIRVTPIAGGQPLNRSSASGVLNIDIFIAAGKGPNRATVIADKLDGFLVAKSFSLSGRGVTQFEHSSLTPLGIDPENRALARFLYSIPFNHYGVT
jgi:hypothetical protein